MPRSVLLVLYALLVACQTTSSTSPTSWPAQAGADSPDVVQPDPGAYYPETPRDYAAYRTWRWQQEPTGSAHYSAAQVRDAVTAELERLGLRERHDASADLTVWAELFQTSRLQQVVEPYGGSQGFAPHVGSFGGGWNAMPRVYAYRRNILVLNLELRDSDDGQAVWRGHGESPVDGADRTRLYQAARRALSGFPP